MTPRKKIKIVAIPGFPAFRDPVLEEAIEAWNDEAEDVDNPIDDDSDNGPIGEDQP